MVFASSGVGAVLTRELNPRGFKSQLDKAIKLMGEIEAKSRRRPVNAPPDGGEVHQEVRRAVQTAILLKGKPAVAQYIKSHSPNEVIKHKLLSIVDFTEFRDEPVTSTGLGVF